MFECEKCGKCFVKKYHYNRHVQSISSCSSNIAESENKKTKHMCQHCGRYFSKNSNLNRHLENNQMCNIFRTFRKDMQSMVDNIHSTNTINNTTNINKNNVLIQMVPPGKEYIDHITQPRLLRILDSTFTNAIKELMRLIYFSEEAPQNNGWCIMYPRHKSGSLKYNHHTNTIERKSTDQVINEQFTNMMNLISPMINDVMTKNEDGMLNLNRTQMRNCEMFYGLFGTTDLLKEHPEHYDNILMLGYNYQNKSLKTWTDNKIQGKYKQITNE